MFATRRRASSVRWSKSTLARLGQQRQMLASGLAVSVDQPRRIIAGEAMVRELRLPGVSSGIPHGSVDPIDRQKSEAVGAHELAHRLEAHARGEQFVALRRVDSVEVGEGN